MNGYEWLSYCINLVIALLLIFYYPRSLAKNFRGRPIPKGFNHLRTLAFWLGWGIIIASSAYIIHRLVTHP